jgi:NAD(P)-dependent dehydrogenase (short-subunit alcohol dehydrogenase family)
VTNRSIAGAIVNATSSAQKGIPGEATYCATKGALASLTYAWSLDLAEHGVRVNGFAPSALTQMADPTRVPTGHLRDPSSNALVVSYLLSDRASAVAGQIVQWRQGSLAVVAHPALTSHEMYRPEWTAELIATDFGPFLAAHAQTVEWRIDT